MRAATPSEFARAPVGRYVAGRNWIYFCSDPELAGFVSWGRLEASDVRELAPIVTAMHARAARYRALVDLRRVESIDATAFELTARYATKYRDVLSAAIDRVALVGNEGFVGALARGYFEVVPKPYRVEVFSDARKAIAWLGQPRAGELLGEIDGIVSPTASSPALRKLRAILDERGARLGLEAAARLLRVSSRTLQRKLAAEGSSFAAEIHGARLRTAQRLMIETDASLTEIAFKAGFSSAAHLSTVFRRELGEAPSVWRANQIRSAMGKGL